MEREPDVVRRDKSEKNVTGNWRITKGRADLQSWRGEK